MNLQSIAKRIGNGDFEYALGRFKTVRRLYSGLQRLKSVGQPFPVFATGSRTLFPGVRIDDVVRTVRQEAVFVGLNLPTHIVATIEAFAKSEPLHAIYDPNGATFHYKDVVHGMAADGRPMPIGGVREPIRCEGVREVVEDPVLRAVIRQYLGYEPNRIRTILDWSFGSNFTDEERRQLKHHVIDYHYDVGGYNFLYVSFYITDTDRNNGAHVMMKRSHDKKPLRMLFGSTTANEQAVKEQYGAENEIMIEGPAGTGFVQDTSCYHRATPPLQGDRLMLAIRCS